MRIIKLMADYQSYPLWEASPGKVGNINPDDLPISKKLKEQLSNFAKIYDETLNLEDPILSAFKSEKEEIEFKQKAIELAEELQKELGKDFVIKTRYL